jgi:mycoredoxin
MLRRWSAAALTAICGVLIAAVKIGDGAPGTAALLMTAFLVLGFVLSPLAFPRATAPSSFTGASSGTSTGTSTGASSGASSPGASSADNRPVVYWRPGADANRLRWVDIWKDPAAAAAVREITGGDETVPTVVIGGQGHVNPDPSWLRDQIVPA